MSAPESFDSADLAELEQSQFPQFVRSEADALRWVLAWSVALRLSGGRPDPLLTSFLYFNPAISTLPGELQEAFEPGKHPRGRGGKFIRSRFDRRGVLQRVRGMWSPGLFSPGIAEEDMELFGRDPEKGPVAREVLGDAFDTKELYREREAEDVPEEMRYSDLRLKTVHDPIIAATLDDHRSQEHPHILVLAGGPASGKSTWLREHPDLWPVDAVHIDADQVKAGAYGHSGIPEYEQMMGEQASVPGQAPSPSPDAYAARGVHRESGDVAKKILDLATERRTNIVLDTTGDKEPGVFARELLGRLAKDYKVDVVYVSTPTDVASELNIARALKEKRFVPTPVLREYHRRVGVNFRDEIQGLSGLSSLRVFDWQRGEIAHQQNGKMVVDDPVAYAEWMTKGDQQRHDLEDDRRERAERQRKLTESREDEPGLPPLVSIEMPFDMDDITSPPQYRKPRE